MYRYDDIVIARKTKRVLRIGIGIGITHLVDAPIQSIVKMTLLCLYILLIQPYIMSKK